MANKKAKNINNEEELIIPEPKKHRKPRTKKEAFIQEPTIQVIESVMEHTIEEEPIPESINFDIHSFSWECQTKEKSKSFYIVLFLITLFLIVAGWKSNNWFLVLIIVLGFVLIVQKGSIKEARFEISENGFDFQGQKIEWKNIIGADIIEYNNEKLLIVSPNVFPYFKLYSPINIDDELKIRYVFNLYTKIKPIEETFIDKLIKKIIF